MLLVALVGAAVRGHLFHDADVAGLDLLVLEEEVLVSLAGGVHEGQLGLVGCEGGVVCDICQGERVVGYVWGILRWSGGHGWRWVGWGSWVRG